MPSKASCEYRIAMRVTPQQKAIIELGAKAKGESVTNFVLSRALQEAETILAERTLFMLDAQGFDQFSAILDRPVQDHGGMRDLFTPKDDEKWHLKE